MEETETPSPAYVKGFNEGYILAKRAPHLAEPLSRMEPQGDRLSGMKAGREQYLAEQTRERLPGWLRNDASPRTRSTPDKEKGRDVEPER
jgi:hypothetical protein